MLKNISQKLCQIKLISFYYFIFIFASKITVVDGESENIVVTLLIADSDVELSSVGVVAQLAGSDVLNS